MWWRVNTYLGQDYTGILCSPSNFSRGLKSFQKKKILTVSIQRLSDFTFTFHFHALEKEMATHSSVLAWRIPGTGEPVGCRLWGLTELDTTEAMQQQQQRQSSWSVSFPAMSSVVLSWQTGLGIQIRLAKKRIKSLAFPRNHLNVYVLAPTLLTGMVVI